MQQQIDVYHGTSTLFLDSILAKGLGGMNPMAEWGLYEMSRKVYELSAKHLRDTKLFAVSSASFERMALQTGGKLNFQHGDTYVSASAETAVRYAISKRYGSELLTYTLDFLRELLQAQVSEAESDLYLEYRHIYGLLDACPSPVLIRATGVGEDALISEQGDSPAVNFAEAYNLRNKSNRDMLLQQRNFRLKKPVEANRIQVWLINVQKWDSLFPEYNLYQLGASTASLTQLVDEG